MGEKQVGETAGVVAEAGGSLFQSLKDVGAKFYKSDRLGWTFAVSDEDASKKISADIRRRNEQIHKWSATEAVQATPRTPRRKKKSPCSTKSRSDSIMVAPPHVDSNSLFIVHANSVCREEIKVVFPNENIRVSYFNEEVNVRDLLKWLTDEFEDKDFVTVFEDQMIQPHWDLLLKMAGGGVNVYNKDTWSSDWIRRTTWHVP